MSLMTARPSMAERLDRALSDGLTGPSGGAEGDLRQVMATARDVASALVPIPASTSFAARLEERLARPTSIAALGALVMRRPPASWLLLTGAVSSAAVGVTALLVWRGTRRAHAHGLRLGQR